MENRLNISPKIILISLITLITLISLIIFYISFKNKRPDSTPSKPMSETQTLVEKIGKHLVLPKGETPTLATVSDKSLLKNQPFFAGAKNGDKVLLYMKAKKAILYDPVADRILDVGPIYLPSPAPISTKSASLSSPSAPFSSP